MHIPLCSNVSSMHDAEHLCACGGGGGGQNNMSIRLLEKWFGNGAAKGEACVHATAGRRFSEFWFQRRVCLLCAKALFSCM